MLKWLFRGVLTLLVLCALVVAFNGSWRVSPADDQHPIPLAHRGVQQLYTGNDRSNDACHASPVMIADHGLIENTLPSMRAAFDAGAQVVELDVHLTTDGHFAVFHDWTVDCRTDGSGVTRRQTMDILRGLDLGYRYTADGETFPLRGTGVGLMSTLTEVLEADLGGQYLVNFKSRDEEEGRLLAELLDQGDFTDQVFGVYGGTEPTMAALQTLPTLRGYDRDTIRDCLVRYMALGWTSVVPEACQNTLLAIPVDYAQWLWGWPHLFTDRMARAGTDVILLAPYDGSGYSSGFDALDALSQVPDHFGGYVWTNRIEVIGPALLDRAQTN